MSKDANHVFMIHSPTCIISAHTTKASFSKSKQVAWERKNPGMGKKKEAVLGFRSNQTNVDINSQCCKREFALDACDICVLKFGRTRSNYSAHLCKNACC